MTIPKKPADEEFRRLQRPKKHAPLPLVIALIVAIIIGAMYSIVTPTVHMVNEENKKAAASLHFPGAGAGLHRLFLYIQVVLHTDSGQYSNQHHNNNDLEE